MHKWQTDKRDCCNFSLSLSRSLSLSLSLYLSCSLCSLAALYKRQSGQRAGNCFHICDNHQHLHRSVATSTIAPQQEAIVFGIISSCPRTSAAQDAAPCTAASAISVHVVDTPTFNRLRLGIHLHLHLHLQHLHLVLVQQPCGMQLTMPTCLAECNTTQRLPPGNSN